MDHEVGQLAERQRVLEDEEIVLMEEEEPLDVALADHQSEAVALAAEEARLVAAVAEAEVELRGGHSRGSRRNVRRVQRGCPPTWPIGTSGCVPTSAGSARRDWSTTGVTAAT